MDNIAFNFDAMIAFYYDKPVEFAEDFLSFQADEKQREIMESVRDHKRTAVRSGQGIGKTATVSCIIIWYLCTRYNAKILATAPNITQLYTVLWAELAKWLQGCPLSPYLIQTKTRLYMNGYEKIWFAFPKTATSAEGIAGQHADHLLIIADEASGIKDDILETLLGTITGAENKLLFISNPTRTSGVYYHAFHQNAASFYRIHVDAESSARVDHENIEMLAKSYGKESNVYRVRVKGEFPTAEDDVFIPMEYVEKAIVLELPPIVAEQVEVIKIGVDVARFGDDETVIATNIHGEIGKLYAWNGYDTMKSTGKIVQLAKALHAQYPKAKIYVIVDEIGVGGGPVDRMREMLVNNELEGLESVLTVVECNVSKGVRSRKYADMTTVLWGIVRDMLEKEELKLPNDIELVGQLSSRKYIDLSNGKMKLESKKEMKKSNRRSPDRADAVAISCMPINLDTDDRSTGQRV